MHPTTLTVYASLIAAVMLATGCATSPPDSSGGAITIERQGSFFVGGRQVTAAGTFDPTASPTPPNAGQTYWIDQMYVQYQIPMNARKLPVVLVHGGGGTGRVCTLVTAQEFANLARIPIQVVYGDNIPKQPIPDLPADGRRAQVINAQQFVDLLNKNGGKASLLLLPDAGLRGNSHFMYSDLNNVQVADQLSAFLAKQGIDAR